MGGEPTTHLVDEATRIARAEGCDLVIALGGGSVIDAGKAVAGLLANPGDVLDYLEVVGGGKPLPGPGVPFVAVPTTAGTGAEATRNAVLDVPEHGVKASLRSPHLLARLAVVDPELTLSLPPEVTAYTGMDALTQLIEPFVSNAANPLVDGVCREGLARAARSLAGRLSRRVRPRGPRGHGAGRPLRRDRPGERPARRGARVRRRPGRGHRPCRTAPSAPGSCPFVMEANIRAVGERGDPAVIRRYVEVARTLTGDPGADARAGVSWVRGLCAEMKIPPLREAGLSVGRLRPAHPARPACQQHAGQPRGALRRGTASGPSRRRSICSLILSQAYGKAFARALGEREDAERACFEALWSHRRVALGFPQSVLWQKDRRMRTFRL